MKKDDDALDLKGLKDNFTNNVKAIATEILDPEVAFTSEYDPESRTCSYCDFAALCR